METHKTHTKNIPSGAQSVVTDLSIITDLNIKCTYHLAVFYT